MTPNEQGSAGGDVDTEMVPTSIQPVEGAAPLADEIADPSAGRPNAGSPWAQPVAGQFGGPGGQRRPQRDRPPARFSPGGGSAPGGMSARRAFDSTPEVGSAGAVAPPAFDEDGTAIPSRRPNCTLAQMRRFIKSRPYVPVHELRRRFEIDGLEDEVSPVTTERGTIFVGLPPEQARFLGELIKSGDVGCEMLLDPDSPGVVGVFPMRPVARQ
jgi:hypothetical protein